MSTNPVPTAAEVRSTLWSLGFYGARNQGMRILEKEGIYASILKLTFGSPTLSLRGTCRYVLNMFSHSEHGRNLLKQSGFHVNVSCYSCYPIQTKTFYHIENMNTKKHYINNENYWLAFNKLQKPMTKSTYSLTIDE